METTIRPIRRFVLIFVKPGDKATVVAYPGAGFSDKMDTIVRESSK